MDNNGKRPSSELIDELRHEASLLIQDSKALEQSLDLCQQNIETLNSRLIVITDGFIRALEALEEYKCKIDKLEALGVADEPAEQSDEVKQPDEPAEQADEVKQADEAKQDANAVLLSCEEQGAQANVEDEALRSSQLKPQEDKACMKGCSEGAPIIPGTENKKAKKPIPPKSILDMRDEDDIARSLMPQMPTHAFESLSDTHSPFFSDDEFEFEGRAGLDFDEPDWLEKTQNITTVCPLCGSEVSVNDKFCMICGHEIEAVELCPDTKEEDLTVDLTEHAKQCEVCGAIIKPGFRFCMECGTKVE